jgi:predicted amidohydrolase
MKFQVLFFIVLLACGVVVAKGQETYRAGAIQFSPFWQANVSRGVVAQRNVELLGGLVQEAAEAGAQIVNMPEGALGWFNDMPFGERDRMLEYSDVVPEVLDGSPKINPCAEKTASESGLLMAFSCMAQRNNIWLVSNLVEVELCSTVSDPNCPPDGRYQWNTLAVFNRDGQLWARYRKNYISGTGPIINQPAVPSPQVFTTDFGVTFGLAICQDISLPGPMATYANLGVRDILWSASWSNLPPLFLAAPLLQRRSQIQDANIIASNEATSILKAGGGLFSRGSIVSIWNDLLATDTRLVVVDDLPRLLRLSQFILRDLPLPAGSVDVLASQPSAPVSVLGFPAVGNSFAATVGEHIIKISFGDIACELDVIVAEGSDETYMFAGGTFIPPQPGTPQVLGYQICVLIECPNFPNCTPGSLNPSAVFERLEIKGKGFSGLGDGLIYPYLVKTLGQPVDATELEARNRGTHMWTTSNFRSPITGGGLLGYSFVQANLTHSIENHSCSRAATALSPLLISALLLTVALLLII